MSQFVTQVAWVRYFRNPVSMWLPHNIFMSVHVPRNNSLLRTTSVFQRFSEFKQKNSIFEKLIWAKNKAKKTQKFPKTSIWSKKKLKIGQKPRFGSKKKLGRFAAGFNNAPLRKGLLRRYAKGYGMLRHASKCPVLLDLVLFGGHSGDYSGPCN